MTDGGTRIEQTGTGHAVKLDARTVEFHRKRGIEIYRSAGGERVDPDSPEFMQLLDRARHAAGGLP